jgi:hypothetical protein
MAPTKSVKRSSRKEQADARAAHIWEFCRKALALLLQSLISLFLIIFIPWRSSYQPIQSLLKADNNDKKPLLTNKWRDRKLAELNSVSITVRCLFSFRLYNTSKELNMILTILKGRHRRLYCCPNFLLASSTDFIL